MKMRIPTNTEWDKLLDIVSKDTDKIHWEKIFSWVHDSNFEEIYPSARALRGYNSARKYSWTTSSTRTANYGFRPVVVSQETGALTSDIQDGSAVIIGTLYMDGKPVKVLQVPTYNGDIVDYIPGTKLEMREALKDTAYQVTAIKLGDVFIADRNLLKNISYDDIEFALTDSQRDVYLSGNYVLLTTYASLSEEEAAAVEDYDEQPLAYMAIQRDFLERWIREDEPDKNMEAFLAEYTYEDIMGLEELAALNGALAFVYRPDLDEVFDFPDHCDGDAISAFADFMSGLLQEHGYKDASKYIDALMEL